MAERFYWLLAQDRWFGRTRYFCFDVFGNPSFTTNPAMAMRWTELYAVEWANSQMELDGNWTPKLIGFEGTALCGGVKQNPTE